MVEREDWTWWISKSRLSNSKGQTTRKLTETAILQKCPKSVSSFYFMSTITYKIVFQPQKIAYLLCTVIVVWSFDDLYFFPCVHRYDPKSFVKKCRVLSWIFCMVFYHRALSRDFIMGHLYITLGHRGGWVVQKMAIFPYFM